MSSSTSAPKRILITAATGTQSSATIRALLLLSTTTAPIAIHAFVRDPTSAKAQALQSLSPDTITLHKGDFDDVPSLKSAAKDCSAAFINVVPAFTFDDTERRHANNILAALAATPTITRVLYTSVNGVGDPTIPGRFKNLAPTNPMYSYNVSKNGIQEDLKKLAQEKGWHWTILQPSWFLTNFLPPMAGLMFPELKDKRRIVTAFPKDFVESFVDPESIGRFAAQALTVGEEEMSGKWNGKEIPLATEICTFEEVVRELEKVLGWKEGEVIVESIPLEEAREQGRQGNVLVYSQVFMVENLKRVDLEEVRGWGIEVGSVKGFFERERERLREGLGEE